MNIKPSGDIQNIFNMKLASEKCVGSWSVQEWAIIIMDLHEVTFIDVVYCLVQECSVGAVSTLPGYNIPSANINKA